MRTILVSFGLILGLALATTASATVHPVRSLNDLPSVWHGVAGNLFMEKAATFEVQRILKASHQNVNGVKASTYDVKAELRLTNRTINVTRILLRKFEINQDVYDMIIVTSDPLVKYIEVSITYDEATNSFTMRDLVRNGQRRFVLSGHAPSAAERPSR